MKSNEMTNDPLLRRYMQDISRHKTMTDEEMTAAVNRGERHLLVTANLRFVIFISRKFWHPNVSKLELISAGNIGLMTAAERYDPSKGRFPTYAYWHIFQQMQIFCVNSADMVRIPINRIKKARKILRELRDDLSSIENEEALGITTRELAEAYQDTMHHASFSSEADDEASPIFRALIINEPSAEDNLIKDDYTRKIDQQLSKILDPRQKEIMISRSNGETLRDIGKKLGITCERVRQIEQRSIEKLQRSKLLEEIYQEAC